mmetsp:Transcript_21259/g.70222  ORF Transcript_21259/g.70222 Transcript_21259/m.70222 type:complete len:208 (+) Transcript_21259:169-792(+)
MRAARRALHEGALEGRQVGGERPSRGARRHVLDPAPPLAAKHACARGGLARAHVKVEGEAVWQATLRLERRGGCGRVDCDRVERRLGVQCHQSVRQSARRSDWELAKSRERAWRRGRLQAGHAGRGRRAEPVARILRRKPLVGRRAPPHADRPLVGHHRELAGVDPAADDLTQTDDRVARLRHLETHAGSSCPGSLTCTCAAPPRRS